MNVIEKANIVYHHRQWLQHEHTPERKVGWVDEQSQHERFHILASVADLSNHVIMDMGCGLGDLKAHLDSRYQNFVYLGIDILPEYIAEASHRFAHKNDTHFITADFTQDGLPEVDYVLACGSLNYQTDNLLFIYRTIEKMYACARKGVAFNLLNEETFPSTTIIKSYNKYEVLSYCLRLANCAELKIGYLEDDFTIYMYK
jgi:trans-aconitate methyltransferase